MFILWVIMLIIALWQIPRLIKQKQYKELITFMVIWLIAGIYATLVVANIPLISPFTIITEFISV